MNHNGNHIEVREEDDFDFKVRLTEQNEELEILNAGVRELERESR
ncbi:MAG: hypothetical protein WA151_05435 [Desulfatirhabdiaceae bacterium]